MKRYSRAWWIDFLLWFAMASIPLILLPPWIADYFNPPRYKGDIFDPPKFALISILGLLLFVLTVLDKKIKRDLLFWLVIAWIGQLFIASLFAKNYLMAFCGTDFKGGRAEGFITFCFYAIFFLSSREYLRFSYKKLYLLGLCLSPMILYALIQYFSFNTTPPCNLNNNPASWDPLVRFRKFPQFIFTTIGNPNFVGTIAALFFVLFSSLFVTLKRWYFVVFSVLFFALLVVAQARSAWVGSGVALLVLVLLSVRFSTQRLPLLLLIGLLSCTALALTKNKSNNVVYAKSKSIFTKKNLDKYGGSGRIMIWNITGKIIAKHPFLGVGPEHLKRAISNEQPALKNEYLRNKGNNIDRAHNELLHMAAIGGIPAALLFIAIAFLSLYTALPHVPINALSLGLCLAIVAYGVQSLFNISVIAVAPVFWILLGALAGKNNANNEAFAILPKPASDDKK
ncbi:MAG: O-antigen ligase family protein [Flavobacteriales bacterium]